MSFAANPREVSGVTIIDVRGRLALGDATARFCELVRREAENNSRLILNMEEVAYVDSAGIGELIGCHMAVKERGGALKLLHGQHLIKYLLNTKFEIFEDESAALASF